VVHGFNKYSANEKLTGLLFPATVFRINRPERIILIDKNSPGFAPGPPAAKGKA